MDIFQMKLITYFYAYWNVQNTVTIVTIQIRRLLCHVILYYVYKVYLSAKYLL